MARTKKLIINSFVGVLSYTVTTILTLVVQRFFVQQLGYNIQGLNSTFTSIIAAISIVELGVGAAIAFALYKPLAENDNKKIAQVVKLFRKLYFILGAIILALGLAIIPLLPILTKHEFLLSEIIFPYLIFLLNSFFTYLFTYNHTLLSADQKQYVISLFTVIFKAVIIGAQIAVLILLQNYILFLAINIVGTVLMNLLLSLYVGKKYPYIFSKVDKLTSDEVKPIKENIFALMYHRVGNYLVTGTGALIVSSVLGVTLAAYYSNYLLLTTALTSLIASLLAGTTAAFGHAIATENKSKVYSLFSNVRFLNLLLYAVAACGVFVLINDILTVWLSEDTVLSLSFLVFITINFYITGYSAPLGNLRAAAGVFKPDRYLHILIAVLNIILSLVLVQFMGITGVLVGTTVSLIIKEIIVLPRIGSKYIYESKLSQYYLRGAKDLLIALLSIAVCWFIYSFVNIEVLIVKIIVGAVICIFVPIIIISLVYFKSTEFKYLTGLVKRFFKIKEKADEGNNSGGGSGNEALPADEGNE